MLKLLYWNTSRLRCRTVILSCVTFAHMTPAAGTGNRVGFMGVFNRVEGRLSHSPFWVRGPFFPLCGNNFTKTSAGAHASAVRIVANISHLENLREIARLNRLIC